MNKEGRQLVCALWPTPPESTNPIPTLCQKLSIVRTASAKTMFLAYLPRWYYPLDIANLIPYYAAIAHANGQSSKSDLRVLLKVRLVELVKYEFIAHPHLSE